MTAKLYDALGSSVIIGRELGRGYEGAVFEMPHAPDRVAKVYHSAIGDAKQRKLMAMAAVSSPKLENVAAWPLKTLHSPRAGPVVGFVMPSVSSWPNIHSIYSPVERKRRFPELRWSFLIHAARNTASVFETLHRCGIVVGDVNQSNVAVNPQSACVRLVDCDSFQLVANATTHLCEVGMAHFTPPELQNTAFRGVVRTENHDAFGLAILCFHMLFMGRHPFAGRFLGGGDMPIERAIVEHRFAYGAIAHQRQMLPPPDTLPFASVGPAVARTFEAAFAESSRAARPTPADWIVVLETLERNLQRCSSDASHEYHGGGTRCPWCQLETRSVFYFIGVNAQQRPHLPFDLAAIWAGIIRVPRPELPLPPSSIPIGALAVTSALTRYRRVIGQTPIGVVLAVAFILLLSGGYGPVIAGVLCVLYAAIRYGNEEDRSLRLALRDAEKKWGAIGRTIEAAAHAQAFDWKLAELQHAHDEHLRLQKELAAELSRLEALKREAQLRTFLERFRIDSAGISGIGPGRAATLASYGVETAADLDRWRIQAVPGFGHKRTQDLLSWRSSLEPRFVFNASTQVPEGVKAAVRKKFDRPLESLQDVLRGGAGVLEVTRRDVMRAHEALRSEAASVASEYARVLAGLSFRPPATINLPEMRLPNPPTVKRPQAASGGPPRAPTVVTTPNPACPRCGKTLLPRSGRRGPFWGCSAYPRCRYTRNR